MLAYSVLLVLATRFFAMITGGRVVCVCRRDCYKGQHDRPYEAYTPLDSPMRGLTFPLSSVAPAWYVCCESGIDGPTLLTSLLPGSSLPHDGRAAIFFFSLETESRRFIPVADVYRWRWDSRRRWFRLSSLRASTRTEEPAGRYIGATFVLAARRPPRPADTPTLQLRTSASRLAGERTVR